MYLDKTGPLTDAEIRAIQWEIWEPLRRNEQYCNDYGGDFQAYPEKVPGKWLEMHLTPDDEEAERTHDQWYTDKSDRFQAQWQVPPINPELSFRALIRPEYKKGETKARARVRVQALFFQRYEPYDDEAALDTFFPAPERGFRTIHISFKYHASSIIQQMKKICESRSFKNVHGEVTNHEDIIQIGKRELDIDEAILSLYVNPTKKKSPIIERLKEIIKENEKQFSCKKFPLKRQLSPDKWALCFEIYDMIQPKQTWGPHITPMPIEEVAEKLNIDLQLVYQYFMKVCTMVELMPKRIKHYEKTSGHFFMASDEVDKTYIEQAKRNCEERIGPCVDAMDHITPLEDVEIVLEKKSRADWLINE